MGIDAGRPLAVFAPNAPAGQAYRDLAAVLVGDADPVPELELGAGEGQDDEAGDERVTPESLTEGIDDGEEPIAGAEVAASVRDAVDAEDGAPEGLLGGELAKAADEIRQEAAGQENESEPRSVDDLLQEHISDDRLGGESDPFDAQVDGDGADDAETDGEPAAETEVETDPFGDTSDDPFDDASDDAQVDGDSDDADPFDDAGDPAADANDPLAADDADDGPAASEDDPLAEAARATDDEVDDPLSGDADADGEADAAGDSTDLEDASGESAIPFERNRPEPSDRQTPAPEPEPEPEPTLDDLEEDGGPGKEENGEGESDGVLGRLGSLFR